MSTQSFKDAQKLVTELTSKAPFTGVLDPSVPITESNAETRIVQALFSSSSSASLKGRLVLGGPAAPSAGPSVASPLEVCKAKLGRLFEGSTPMYDINNLSDDDVKNILSTTGISKDDFDACIVLISESMTGGAWSAGDLTKIISACINSNDYIIHNGKQILNVPNGQELLERFVTPSWYESIGVPVSNSIDFMKDNRYKHVPKDRSDALIAALGVTSNTTVKDAIKSYTECVMKIRDVLANNGISGVTKLNKNNVVQKPTSLSYSALNRYPAAVKAAIITRRNSDPSMDPSSVGILSKLGSISVSVPPTRIMVGGNNLNSHAPLYPTVVMNGGAHPLAMIGGDASVSVDKLEAHINDLTAQYKSVTGVDVSYKAQIDTYKNNAKSELEKVQQQLNALNGAIPVLSQYPLGLGINAASFDQSRLESIAEQGKKLNEQAARASRKFDKLTQIRDLLQELVNKSRSSSNQIPDMKGGALHSALKH